MSGQISHTKRIEQFAERLPIGKIITASEAVAQIKGCQLTPRGVGLIFRSMPNIMEFIPDKNHGRGKWKRI